MMMASEGLDWETVKAVTLEAAARGTWSGMFTRSMSRGKALIENGGPRAAKAGAGVVVPWLLRLRGNRWASLASLRRRARMRTAEITHRMKMKAQLRNEDTAPKNALKRESLVKFGRALQKQKQLLKVKTEVPDGHSVPEIRAPEVKTEDHVVSEMEKVDGYMEDFGNEQSLHRNGPKNDAVMEDYPSAQKTRDFLSSRNTWSLKQAISPGAKAQQASNLCQQGQAGHPRDVGPEREATVPSLAPMATEAKQLQSLHQRELGERTGNLQLQRMSERETEDELDRLIASLSRKRKRKRKRSRMQENKRQQHEADISHVHEGAEKMPEEYDRKREAEQKRRLRSVQEMKQQEDKTHVEDQIPTIRFQEPGNFKWSGSKPGPGLEFVLARRGALMEATQKAEEQKTKREETIAQDDNTRQEAAKKYSPRMYSSNVLQQSDFISDRKRNPSQVESLQDRIRARDQQILDLRNELQVQQKERDAMIQGHNTEYNTLMRAKVAREQKLLGLKERLEEVEESLKQTLCLVAECRKKANLCKRHEVAAAQRDSDKAQDPGQESVQVLLQTVLGKRPSTLGKNASTG